MLGFRNLDKWMIQGVYTAGRIKKYFIISDFLLEPTTNIVSKAPYTLRQIVFCHLNMKAILLN